MILDSSLKRLWFGCLMLGCVDLFDEPTERPPNGPLDVATVDVSVDAAPFDAVGCSSVRESCKRPRR